MHWSAEFLRLYVDIQIFRWIWKFLVKYGMKYFGTFYPPDSIYAMSNIAIFLSKTYFSNHRWPIFFNVWIQNECLIYERPDFKVNILSNFDRSCMQKSRCCRKPANHLKKETKKNEFLLDTQGVFFILLFTKVER